MTQMNNQTVTSMTDDIREVQDRWLKLVGRELERETILVVEDDEKLRTFLLAVLGRYGYKVILAADGTEGVRKFAVHKKEIQLVLLDMGLPGMSGEKVLSMILAIQSCVKVIAVSGLIRPEVRDAAMQMGASDYMSKPYLSDELLLKVHDTLQSTLELNG